MVLKEKERDTWNMSFTGVTNFSLFSHSNVEMSQKHTQIVSMGVVSDNKDGVRKLPHKEKIYSTIIRTWKKPLTTRK